MERSEFLNKIKTICDEGKFLLTLHESVVKIHNDEINEKRMNQIINAVRKFDAEFFIKPTDTLKIGVMVKIYMYK